MESIKAAQAVQYRVVSCTTPHVGVVLEITIATPSGEQRLPAVWLAADQARKLAAALEHRATTARTLS